MVDALAGVGAGGGVGAGPEPLEEVGAAALAEVERHRQVRRRDADGGDAGDRGAAEAVAEHPVEREDEPGARQRRRQRQPADPRRGDLEAVLGRREREVEVRPEPAGHQRRAGRDVDGDAVGRDARRAEEPGRQPLRRGEDGVELGLADAPAAVRRLGLDQRLQALGEVAGPRRRRRVGRAGVDDPRRGLDREQPEGERREEERGEAEAEDGAAQHGEHGTGQDNVGHGPGPCPAAGRVARPLARAR